MQTQRYRIRNWSDYNKALIQRGSLTIWVEESSLKKWLSVSCTGSAGRPPTYSDEAILMMLVLRERFGLSLRSLQGFVISLFTIMGIVLPVPSYTQISRRATSLHKRLRRLSDGRPRHLIFDSTGLKVHGEGEWKVKVHGKGKRRVWKKFHVGVDAETQDIVMCELTGRDEGDAVTAGKMLDRHRGRLKSVRGDGAYDAGSFRNKVHQKGGQTIVPPPRNAVYKQAYEGWERGRDAALAEIEGLGGGEIGRKLWKKLTRYHLRSLVETTMFRLKKMLGPSLRARSSGAQRTEVYCKCLVINKMNKLGLPCGEWVNNAA